MDTKQINETHQRTLAGDITFPEVVRNLLAAGVEYYQVDYVAMQKAYYSAAGERVVAPITFEGMPPVAADFDRTALLADLLDSQRNGQHYRDFSRRAMAAGAQAYYAFLRGQRVMYLGRQGDQHIEWFPGAASGKT